MNEIIEAVCNEDDMLYLKEYMLAAMQLYYDGILQNPVKNGVWHQLCDLSTQAILCYYKHMKRPDDFLDKLKQIQEQLIDHSPVMKSKQRHLTGDEYFVEKFVKAASSSDINLIIAVASGGFEPALYLSALRDIEMDAVRYSSRRGDREVRFYGNVPDNVKGRRVLIVDDILASGDTAYEVSEWVKLQKPEAAYFGIVKNLGNVPVGFRKINENLYEIGLGSL